MKILNAGIENKLERFYSKQGAAAFAIFAFLLRFFLIFHDFFSVNKRLNHGVEGVSDAVAS